MTTEPVLDIEALLAPIDGETPAGVDVREGDARARYLEVRQARNDARTEERARIADDPDADAVTPAGWRVVADTVPELLATETKDLELCAWLIEAIARREGFAGVRDGYRLADGLVTQFWDGLYPLPEDDSLELRLRALEGLNGAGSEGTLIQPIRLIPLTEGGADYSYWHYQQAQSVAALTDPEKREARVAAGAVTMDQFNAAVRQTSPAFYGTLVADIEAALEAFNAMTASLDERCGKESPASTTIRNLLQEVLAAVRLFARDKLQRAADSQAASAAEAAVPAAAAGQGNGADTGAGAGVPLQGSVAGREEAFQQLLRIADFFRRTEPHSPVGPAIEDIVRRARMDFFDLIAELIPDEEARQAYLLRAGVRPRIDPSAAGSADSWSQDDSWDQPSSEEESQ